MPSTCTSGRKVHPNVSFTFVKYQESLDTRLRTQALVLPETLGLVAALAGGVAGAACAAVHLALGAGFFGHGGGLVGAVDGSFLLGPVSY